MPESVVNALKCELRKKEAKRQEEEALKEAEPTLIYLNEKLPHCKFSSVYYPESWDEVAQVEAWAAETESILLDDGIITEKQWNDLCAVYVSEDGTYMMVDDYIKYFDENLK